MNFDNSGPVINQTNPSIRWNTDSGLSFDSSLKKDYSLTYGDGWMPSAPSPGLVLFNSEEQSDLIFIVTMDSNHDKDDLKFPGHSFIIKDSSPIFKDIIHELNQRQNNSDQKPIINIQCQPETLHMLMSYIYKKEVEFSCVSSCLALLEVSVKFILTDLNKICLTFLWNCATEFNVLQILSTLRRIELNHKKASIIGSDKHMSNYYQNHLPQFDENYENLLNEVNLRCYQILDENADKILQSEAICILDRDMLIDILHRDTLNLTSELTAFNCLQRWSVHQCQRELREIGYETKSDLLGEAKYAVRYLTMDIDQFTKGPYSSDILSMDDKRALHEKLIAPEKQLPDHLLAAKLDIPRKFFKSSANGKSFFSSLPSKRVNRSTSTVANFERKKNSALKKLLNGLGDVMIFAIRIFD